MLVDRVRVIAERRGIKAGQLALAWYSPKTTALYQSPALKRLVCLEEKLAAAAINPTPEEVSELEASVPASEVAGDRYSPQNMKVTDR